MLKKALLIAAAALACERNFRRTFRCPRCVIDGTCRGGRTLESGFSESLRLQGEPMIDC